MCEVERTHPIPVLPLLAKGLFPLLCRAELHHVTQLHTVTTGHGEREGLGHRQFVACTSCGHENEDLTRSRLSPPPDCCCQCIPQATSALDCYLMMPIPCFHLVPPVHAPQEERGIMQVISTDGLSWDQEPLSMSLSGTTFQAEADLSDNIEVCAQMK